MKIYLFTVWICLALLSSSFIMYIYTFISYQLLLFATSCGNSNFAVPCRIHRVLPSAKAITCPYTIGVRHSEVQQTNHHELELFPS